MKNILTNKLGLARSLFALALLLTLLVNDKDVLFLETMSIPEQATFLEQMNLFFLFGYEGLEYSYFIAIAILTMAFSGYYPRVNGIFHWWVCFSFFSSSIIVEGGDQVGQIFTLLLIPITLLDARRNHFDAPIEVSENTKYSTNAIWFILKVQAALIYLEAGIGKIYASTEWIDGSGLYYWINNAMFGRGDALVDFTNILMTSPHLTYILTNGVILFEITLFGALFSTNQKFKNFIFVIALLFHFSIIIYFGLISFFLNMTGLLVIYLLDLSQPMNLNLKQVKASWNEGLNQLFNKRRTSDIKQA